MDVAALSSLAQTTSAVAAPTPKSLQPVVAAKPDNMLAGNFVQADAGPSKYLQARLDSLQTEKSFANSMSNLLTTMTAQFATTMANTGSSSGDSTFVAAVINKYKVEDSIGRAVDKEVGDSAQDNLDATRQDIEDKAEAASTGQSQDAAGQGTATPGATATAQATGATPTDDAASATEAIQAAAEAAQTAPTGQTAEAEPAGQAAQAGQIAAAQEPAQPVPPPGSTIDIQV
ncbi:MAG: hypothetical protein B193_3652 [Solidesulfovibrio magneticus str. Maddingley MBC34]|uniref:Uncharacterized protein n=1 Tax=Solidesulfovibrio magneticus str. Maddingley MBC34 TaxID=1206767 RepID=K6G983_9BACT|nr:MAG: hypothetical protein B193_3652 [Solidesulfovibrio magneticus str. Maddingley MBC34]